MLEFKAELVDAGEFNFHAKLNSSCSLTKRKKYLRWVTLKELSQFDCKYWILDTSSIFKWEKKSFMRCKVHSEAYVFNFKLSKLFAKDLNWRVNLPIFFAFLMVSMTFRNLGGTQLLVSWPARASTKVLARQKVLGFLKSSETRFIRK